MKVARPEMPLTTKRSKRTAQVFRPGLRRLANPAPRGGREWVIHFPNEERQSHEREDKQVPDQLRF